MKELKKACWLSDIEKIRRMGSTSTDVYEHRETYVMGLGFYLKKGTAESGGWRVTKRVPGTPESPRVFVR